MNKNLKIMPLLKASVLAISIFALMGCSLRNRNFDYLRQPVEQQPALKIPQGVTAPKMQPYATIPPGPSAYPATTQATLLPPPGYAQQFDPKTIPKTTEAAVPEAVTIPSAPAPAVTVPATSTSTSVKPTQAQLQQQYVQVQKEIADTQAALTAMQLKQAAEAKSASSVVAPVTTPPLTTEPSIVMPAVAPVVAAKTIPTENTLLTLPATASKTSTPVPIVPAASAPISPVPATVPAATLLSLPTASASPGVSAVAVVAPVLVVAKPLKHWLASSMAKDSSDVATLSIQAPYQTVWNLLPTALKNSGFTTVTSDVSKGFYFIVPQGQLAQGNTWMLYINAQGSGTNITLYNNQAQPDSSAQGYALLVYIQQHLVGS